MLLYEIGTILNGKLIVMPAPTNLALVIEKLLSEKIHTVVSLLTEQEMRLLRLDQEENSLRKKNIQFIHYPIDDFGLPASAISFKNIIDVLMKLLLEGKNIVIHCHGGIGRSGLVAGALLICNGYSLEAALDLMFKKRGVEMPETDEQVGWLENWHTRYGGGKTK